MKPLQGTRYSRIIGYVLAWQLLMPLLCFCATKVWFIATVTAIVFTVLYLSKNWERNTYSLYSSAVVALFSLLLVVADIFFSSAVCCCIMVLWVYAMVAYTATSPYPLLIRMPVIIYTLAYIFMLPGDDVPISVVVPIAMAFSVTMWLLALRWKKDTIGMTSDFGPSEPPYSFSLAAAIVSAVVIDCLSAAIASALESNIPHIMASMLLMVICLWLLYTKDWQKNFLAIGALILMIIYHIASLSGHFVDGQYVRYITVAFCVSPVMFHTTAPVFRGMRIVITLFAVYSAINRAELVEALSFTTLSYCQQHIVLVAIDAITAIVLFAMALHWRRNAKSPCKNGCGAI